MGCCHSKPIRKFSTMEESSPRQQGWRSPVELVYVQRGRAGSPTLSSTRQGSASIARSSVSSLDESNTLMRNSTASISVPTNVPPYPAPQSDVCATILPPPQTDICTSEPLMKTTCTINEQNVGLHGSESYYSNTSINCGNTPPSETFADTKPNSNDTLTISETILPLTHGSLTDIHTSDDDPSSKTSFIIDENKISFLLEKLVDYAHKWKEIGIALGFPPSQLQVIEAKPSLHVGAPNSWLTEMLSRWVQWTPETQHGKYATLEDLVKALKSKTVGLAAVAEEIKKEVAETHSTSNPSQLQQESVTSDQINQSKLSRHKSLTRSDSEIAIEFELIPPDPSASPLDHYVFYLLSCFTYSREPADKWPQIEAKEYIHLAVVSNEYYNRKDLEEFRKATLHGSIDDILQSKAPIDFSDLLKPNRVKGKRNAIKRILLEGAPGIGKSTISWEICRKWGNGELFQEYSLVVLIRFRDPWVQKVNSISDLFRFPGEPEMQCEVAKQIKRTQGKGLLLILEGFDEAPPALRSTDTLFFELFKGSLLPNATVMVTTRPSASYDLQRCCKGESSRRIEVLGFGEKEIKEYIESAFIENTLEEKEDFYKYLELYPHIYSMMYVPLNSAIVTRVYQSCRSSSTIVPKTMTQLYTALVKTMLLRYVKEFKEYEYIEIDSFNDLPVTILEKFHEVCKLAYQGINKPEKQIIFSGLRKDFDSLGIMQSVPELYIDKGASVSFNFLHLTIQEYLAAYHLSQLSEGQQVTFLENSEQREVQVVARFLAGLSPSSVCKFLATKYVSTDPNFEWSINKSKLHLLFELHDTQALSSILLKSQKISFENNDFIIPGKAKYHNILDSSIQFHRESLLEIDPEITYDRVPRWSSNQAFDCYVLGYCISSSCCKWKVAIESKYLEIFIKGMRAVQQSNRPGSDVTLIVTDGEYGKIFSADAAALYIIHIASLIALSETNIRLTLDIKGLITIDISDDISFKALKVNAALQVLSLSGVKCRINNSIQQIDNANLHLHNSTNGDFSTSTVSTLCSALLRTKNCLTNLLLKSCELKTDDAIILSEALKGNSTLLLLNLSENEIGDEGAAALAEALKKNSTLVSLSLGQNHIGDEGAAAIAKVLENGSALESLSLYRNAFGDRGATAIAHMLTVNSSLINFDLCHNQLKYEGAVALAKGLENNSSLESLFLLCNHIGDKEAAAVARMLTVNSTLIDLDLSGNEIKDEGVVALAKGLERNSTLESLFLIKENHIGNDGAAAIANMLTINSSLNNLDLRGNELEDEGVMMLLDSVRLRNTTMKMLKLQTYRDSLGESPPDCDQIKLSPRFCNRHQSIVYPKPQLFQSSNLYQTHADSDSGTDYEDID